MRATSIRKVLIVQPYGIGDLLFLTPVLRALRLLPTVERVDLLLGSRTETVVANNPHVDVIYKVDKDLFHRQGQLRSLRDMWSLGKTLRANQYDTLIDYSMRAEYGFFGLFFLGISRRIGFSYKRRGWFHNYRYSLKGGYRGKHVTDYFCELVEKAGIPVEDRFMEIFPASEEMRSEPAALREAGIDSNARLLMVSPGGGESWGPDAHFKRWPVHCFAGLIQRMRSEIAFDAVAVVGSPGEKDLTGDLVRSLEVPAIDLAGKADLSQVVSLMDRSVLFLGNDGGLVHMAHARSLPVIALYGPVDPNVYGPYPRKRKSIAVYKQELDCRPCYVNFRYKSDCVHRDCLQSLSVDEVFNQLKSEKYFEQMAVSVAV